MKLKGLFEMVELGDEVVAVPVGQDANRIHGVLKLNKAGLEIVELLKSETSVEAIVNVLEGKYQNSRENLEDYVDSFIATLIENGLLED